MKTPRKHIFIVDDENDIQTIVAINLTSANFDTSAFSSAEEAMAAMRTTVPDLIILDIMMEGMDGIEFCRILRSDERYRSIPIIFLSAKSEEFDRVLGLEIGGDDYVTKPFSVKELVARVKVQLRRGGTMQTQSGDKRIVYQGLELYPERYELKLDGAEVRLTKTEFDILTVLLTHPGKLFSRDNLINSVRGDDVFVVDRTIDVHIMNLRKKLGPYKDIIATVAGVGYGFRELG